MHSIKRAVLTLIAAILCASFINGQTSKPAERSRELDDRQFIEKAITQIEDEFATAELKEKSLLSAWVKAKEELEAKLQVSRQNKQLAEAQLIAGEQRLRQAQERFAVASAGPDTGGTYVKAARSELDRATVARATASERYEALSQEERVNTERLQQAEAQIQAATTIVTNNAAARLQRKTVLEKLADKWQKDRNETNLIAVTDAISQIACEANISANPFWKTTPNAGANIYYQSIGERRRNVKPTPINNPTETQQPICIGKYYVWAERGGAPTSNKDKTFIIYLGVNEIIVVEDR